MSRSSAGVIRAARSDEAGLLSEIAFRSKAYWGYSEEFMVSCREELTVTAELRSVVLGNNEQHVWLIARLFFGRDGGDVRQLHALKSHMRAATFVENADGFVVDHRQARVARAAPFIEEQLRIRGPREAAVVG